jgi:hypothetical protein
MHPVSFASIYAEAIAAAHPSWREIVALLRASPNKYRFFNAAQIVKHYLGLKADVHKLLASARQSCSTCTGNPPTRQLTASSPGTEQRSPTSPTVSLTNESSSDRSATANFGLNGALPADASVVGMSTRSRRATSSISKSARY